MQKPSYLESTPIASTPILLRLEHQNDQVQLESLASKIQHTVDDYKEQLKELFAINNPQSANQPEFNDLFENHLAEKAKEAPLWQQGVWVFYPWSSTLVHVLEDDDYQKVRFARNRNLITEEEQQRFYHSTIGIAGLSVGNSVALCIVLQGGARHIRLADFDQLALSNLNRIRSGCQYLGQKKVEMTARQIFELNPFAQVELFRDGVTKDSIEDFIGKEKKLDILIDEIDNLAVKYLLREHAKKHRIPVLMGADNGDNAVIDIERHDLDSPPFFHDRMGSVSYEQLASLKKFEIGRMIGKLVGLENIPPRMLASLAELGKTLVSWPQLGGAALLNGCAISYCARKILNGQELETNRAHLSLDEKLTPEFLTPEYQQTLRTEQNKYKPMFE